MLSKGVVGDGGVLLRYGGLVGPCCKVDFDIGTSTVMDPPFSSSWPRIKVNANVIGGEEVCNSTSSRGSRSYHDIGKSSSRI